MNDRRRRHLKYMLKAYEEGAFAPGVGARIREIRTELEEEMSTEVEVSELPTCDMCRAASAAVDGKTTRGPWANMCDPCYQVHGTGLGTGRGQRLVLRGGGE